MEHQLITFWWESSKCSLQLQLRYQESYQEKLVLVKDLLVKEGRVDCGQGCLMLVLRVKLADLT